jgi:polyhydroxybutyrate depolymerase
MPERIAAVGLVAGAYFYPWEACQPTRPVPVIAFHGTEDPIVPFEGGPGSPFREPFPTIRGWIDTLAQRNGCGPVPDDLPPSGVVSGVRYTDCAADVVFYTVAGGGHTWPGGEPLPTWIAGDTVADLDATQTMWAFFEAHPLSEP